MYLLMEMGRLHLLHCAKDFCNALAEIIVVDDNTAKAINPNIR
jgi:hypothetical protein